MQEITTNMYIGRIADAIKESKAVKKKDLSKAPSVLNFEAPPGVGKTEIARSVAVENGALFSVVDAQLLNNPGDIAGALNIENGNTVTASRDELFGDLMRLKEGQAGMLLIDDIKRLHPQILQEVMPLLQDGRVGPGKFLGRNVIIVCTSNPDGGIFMGTKLDPAQKSRMVSYNLGIDVISWIKWASENDVHDAIIAYISELPDALYDSKTYTVNPRMWTIFSDELKSIENSSTLSTSERLDMVRAAVNTNLSDGHDFESYYTNYNGGNKMTVMQVSKMIKEDRISDIIKHLDKAGNDLNEKHKVLRLVMAAAKKYGAKAKQVVEILSCDAVTIDMAHVYLVFWRKDDKMFNALSNSEKLKDYIRQAYFGGGDATRKV